MADTPIIVLEQMVRDIMTEIAMHGYENDPSDSMFVYDKLKQAYVAGLRRAKEVAGVFVCDLCKKDSPTARGCCCLDGVGEEIDREIEKGVGE